VRGAAVKNEGATGKDMTAPLTPEASLTDCSGIPPYMSTEQLTTLTPWTFDAVEKMIARGMLVRNVHFFQPGGRRSQRIFKWSRIVELIEGHAVTSQNGSVVDEIHPNGRVAPGTGRTIDVEKATRELHGLLS
jgi:hypothetical protein